MSKKKIYRTLCLLSDSPAVHTAFHGAVLYDTVKTTGPFSVSVQLQWFRLAGANMRLHRSRAKKERMRNMTANMHIDCKHRWSDYAYALEKCPDVRKLSMIANNDWAAQHQFSVAVCFCKDGLVSKWKPIYLAVNNSKQLKRGKWWSCQWENLCMTGLRGH